MELAAVGGDEFVQGFRLAGIRKAYGVSPDRLERKIEEVLEDPDVGVLILLTDDMGRLSAPLRRRLGSVPRPVVISVGKQQEEDLRTKVRRAIGVDLLR